ncbi:hypothetical protein L914_10505 [Phytophthora nicotianae]|uniref:FLYWCH-type domain-containing protein n=1 Tax=Phytophthora nicotianae TaxID=4792 RepID=W2N6S3_PHYNI|nr:hypothetical protein L914_10505 [Phytophthora nicotianae]
MEHKNFTYSVKSRYNGTVYYICSHFRSASCPARLIVKSSGSIEEVGEHACVRESETVIEATEEMREVLEALATTDMSVVPSAGSVDALQDWLVEEQVGSKEGSAQTSGATVGAVSVRPSGFEIERDLDRPGTSRCFNEDGCEPTRDYLFAHENERRKNERERERRTSIY